MKLLRSTAKSSQKPNVFWLVLCAASVLIPCARADEAGWTEPKTGMTFTRMAKACYSMGVADDQPARQEGYVFTGRVQHEMPAHEVCLDEFWIARFEVTEAQWQTLMGAPLHPIGAEYPVTDVSWQDARMFAQRLSESVGNGERFRLPTEAEWEYACRAGEPASSQPPYANEIADKAWFSFYYDKKDNERYSSVHPVGTRLANAAGLHDMLGNAWEWVEDSYRDDAYKQHARQNPVIEQAGSARAIRGGSFRTARHFIRCAGRAWQEAAAQTNTIGFRLVRVPQGGK